MLFPGFPTFAAFAWGGFVSLAFAADLVGASNEVDPDAVNACQCTGLDYSDSGSYLVDSSTSGNFSFASQFQGNCTDGVASPILRDPDNNEYHCTNIRPTPLAPVLSCSDIPYSDLKTGLWAITIYMSPSNLTVTRTFRLTVGVPSTVVTTTRSTTLSISTFTTPCSALQTSTTTVRLPNTIITVTSTIIDYTTDDRITSSATTTSTVTASCVYKTTARSTAKTSSAKSSSVKSTVKSSTTKSTSVTVAPPVTKAPTVPTGLFTFTVSNSVCAGNPPFA
ncbi:hypothetical protein B0T26DRAFT_861652, partial [Lasiosphaeria miniovina]